MTTDGDGDIEHDLARRRFYFEHWAEYESTQRTFGPIALTVVVILLAPFPLLSAEFQQKVCLRFDTMFLLVLPTTLTIVATTLVYDRFGIESRAFRIFDDLESLSIQIALGAAMILSGRPDNPYWVFYILHVANIPARPWRWSTVSILAATPIIVVLWYWWQEGLSPNTWTALGVLAAGLLFLFYCSGLQRRLSQLAFERGRLHEQVLELQLESERNRIARDLHDGLSADLTAIAWKAETLAHDNEPVESDLQAIARRARAAIDDTRAVVWALRGDPIPWETLASSVRSRCAELCADRVSLDLDVSVERDGLVPGDLALDVLRIIQEAVRNALRHAQPSRLRVTMAIDDSVLLQIDDDGRGIEPSRVQHPGRGLRNLKTRVAANGGDIRFDSLEPGTRVAVSLPLPS